MVAHFSQVRVVERLEIRVVDALGVDVGVSREGRFVPSLRDVWPSDASCLANEVFVCGADARRFYAKNGLSRVEARLKPCRGQKLRSPA
jgi:hypothetical protein